MKMLNRPDESCHSFYFVLNSADISLLTCRAMGDVSDRIGRPTDNGQVSFLVFDLILSFSVMQS